MKNSTPTFWLTSKGLVTLVLIIFAGYLLFVEHRHHLVEWLPYLIILLCPLMHLFMHRVHEHHAHKLDDHDESDATNDGAHRNAKSANAA